MPGMPLYTASLSFGLLLKVMVMVMVKVHDFLSFIGIDKERKAGVFEPDNAIFNPQ
jgi:hypothetical protein